MPDVIIKNVPLGAEEAVKNLALVAIERHLSKTVVATKSVRDKFESDLDAILVANGMLKKFDKAEVVATGA